MICCIGPVDEIGAVTSEDDSILHADSARLTNGIDCLGILVGAISDNLGDYSPGVPGGESTGSSWYEFNHAIHRSASSLFLASMAF